jgi:hypothetical protein
MESGPRSGATPGIGVGNDLGHTLDVTSCGLEQSAQVSASLRVDIASAQTKEGRIFLAERQESPTQSLQGRWGTAFLLPITNLSGVASTVTLDDASIVPYYAYQVPWIQEVLESDKVELIRESLPQVTWRRCVPRKREAAKPLVVTRVAISWLHGQGPPLQRSRTGVAPVFVDTSPLEKIGDVERSP